MTVVWIQLAVFVGFLVAGGLIGRYAERRHVDALDRREADLGDIVVTDLGTPPAGVAVHGATMVVGEAVIATDYFKRFAAGLRNLIGGEIRGFRVPMDRGRREARVRMVDGARQAGADLVLNARYETSIVARGAIEVLCYGTAVRTQPGMPATGAAEAVDS